MSKIDEIAGAVAQLALNLATEANGTAVPFDQRLDAFKALTQYYGVVRKVDGKDDSDDDTKGRFNALRTSVQSAANPSGRDAN